MIHVPEALSSLQQENELGGLIDNGMWKVVLQEVSPNANVLNGRFVVTIQNKGTWNELYKARFVVQGPKFR